MKSFLFRNHKPNHLNGKYVDWYKEWSLQSFPLSILIACKTIKNKPLKPVHVHYIKTLIHRSILWLSAIYSIVCYYVQYKLIIPQINNFRDTLINMELVIFSFLCIVLKITVSHFVLSFWPLHFLSFFDLLVMITPFGIFKFIYTLYGSSVWNQP